nr:MAG TPA: hypothetical protein [Caudoviricetes sp.]
MIRVEQSGYVGRRNIESKLWDCGKKRNCRSKYENRCI